MNRLFFLFLIFFAISMIQSCATPKKSIMRKDPLIGKIINTQENQAINFESLIKDISAYDVIYLSEKHDNPEHHHIQQRVIRSLIENGLNPTIGFEFFSMDNTPDLLNFVDSGKVTHSKKIEKIIEADLRKKLRWDTHSDQMWRYYYDLLSMAKKEKLQVAGIDLPGTLKKRITRKGINGISPIEKEQVFSTKLSDEAYKDYMFSIFKAVHCGMGHGKMQSRLYDTWVARNDEMALSVTRLYNHRKGPIVIIIGGGHTEYGLGVINRVMAIDNTIKQVNIALREISVNPSDSSEYLMPLDLEGFEKVPPADYLWFTQRVSYADPCEEFKKSLQKMKRKSAKD
ncbi:ChaN family lipoprotein [Desulfobacula sp.]|uniref:ChaN family lipoprotein n=1 Tax=Desulfobacula sp. TaxID=2593537 RepID=UPI00261C2D22|nr:ChaN family lipoprotein [Desulfobacula sp.]